MNLLLCAQLAQLFENVDACRNSYGIQIIQHYTRSSLKFKTSFSSNNSQTKHLQSQSSRWCSSNL